MKNHYQQLGVSETATQDDIKKAYKRLALMVHPDRVNTGNEEQFKRLRTAYETLSDPEKRRLYDDTLHRATLAAGLEHVTRLQRQGLQYRILDHPELYNHYQYINAVFNLEGSKALVPGQDLSPQQRNTYWEMINYVDYNLCRRKEFLEKAHLRSHQKIKEELQLITLNLDKICIVSPVLLGCDKRKQLYDLAMGFSNDEELLAIGRLIGGADKLLGHIQKEVCINSAAGIFALKKAGCLTPQNFKQLLLLNSNLTFIGVSSTLVNLLKVDLLTQANFDFIIKQQAHALEICKGLWPLERAGIFTQKYFEAVVNAKDKAEYRGLELEALKEAGLLNEANFNVITRKALTKDICSSLRQMEEEGQLHRDHTSATLLWKGPEALHLLTHRLDQLVAHGLYLLSQDVEKGKTALLLGLELKGDLKIFAEQSPAAQKESITAFKESFIHKLHSKDKEMSLHRTRWKILLANIAIALTGVGLIALGIHYAVTGQGFFANTKREQLIAAIDESNRLLQG